MEDREVLGYIKEAFDLKSQECYKQAIEMLYKALEIESDNIEILYQLGELYYLLQNFGRASQYLEKVLGKNDKHIDTLKLLRKIYFSLDDYKKAYLYAEKCLSCQKNEDNLSELIKISGKLKDFETVKDYENDDFFTEKVMYTAAKAYYENKNLSASKEILEKAYSKNPKNDDILILLGKIYFDENNFDKSKEIFSHFSKNSDIPEVLNYQGLFALEDMKFIDAIKYFAKACSINKTESRYFFNLGNAYFFNGWLEEAENAYSKAIKLAQDNLDYRYALAYLFYERNMFDKAKKEVDYILSHDEKHIQAIVLNALLKYENKDFLGAKNDLENNVKLGFDDDLTLISLSKVYAELNMFEKAEEAVKKVIERNPDSMHYAGMLADVYIKENKSDEALKIVDDIIKNNENYIMGYVLGAKAAYSKNDLDKTKEYAQEAVSLDMNYPEGYYYLAKVRFSEKDYEEAVECMKRAIMYDVNNAEYYAEMSRIYKEQGDIKTALEYIKEAENIDGATEYKIMYRDLASLNRKTKKN